MCQVAHIINVCNYCLFLVSGAKYDSLEAPRTTKSEALRVRFKHIYVSGANSYSPRKKASQICLRRLLVTAMREGWWCTCYCDVALLVRRVLEHFFCILWLGALHPFSNDEKKMRELLCIIEMCT